MIEKTFKTLSGTIHYWLNECDSKLDLIFLPGLTADYRLFDKQIDYFKDKYSVFVWNAPGHATSYPFELNFNLFDTAKWLNEILSIENLNNPVVIGQSMGGYLGQVYAELFPEKIKGFVAIDTPSLQRKYYTSIELGMLKIVEPIFRVYPWKALLKNGSERVSTTEYGRKLMLDMLLIYDGEKNRYAHLVGHGYKILAEAIEKKLPYNIRCPHIFICGEEDQAGSCIRYLKEYEKETGEHVYWIKGAGHNSNTDRPEIVNDLIDSFVEKLDRFAL